MRIALNALRQHSCQNAWHEVLKRGKLIGGVVEISNCEAHKIFANCAQPIPAKQPIPPRLEAIPYKDWPFLLKLMVRRPLPTDTGLGDIVERRIGPIGGEAFKKWWKKIFGKDCGCGARKEWLNQVYPLK